MEGCVWLDWNGSKAGWQRSRFGAGFAAFALTFTSHAQAAPEDEPKCAADASLVLPQDPSNSQQVSREMEIRGCQRCRIDPLQRDVVVVAHVDDGVDAVGSLMQVGVGPARKVRD